ncbi:predicted protein [Lichtheimia corymbifera JMRC:FSU:9682]|uniref:Uncharacterized protein n=1 Tax=Lichtheimia corymbifera JMRC:FSU:9682 TaxID=1263082 RepID=A0A068SEC4_9FUNG|nr:predicted protein [Lichtheimia corymbifera JMRC:FSU:9682]
MHLPDIDYINILVNIGIVIGGALLFPIVFTIVLTLLGFTSAGILAGSVAAFTMSCCHPISGSSAFACLQSLGAIGFFGILVNPFMLLVEVIAGVAMMVYLWVRYSFDTTLLWNDWSGVVHIIAMVFNYGLSIVANMLGGALAGMLAGYLVSLCCRAIRSICCERSIQLPIYHTSDDSSTSATAITMMVFSFIGLVTGVVLAIMFPYNIIPL